MPSGKEEDPGESGDMGEWSTHELAAAMVGLPGGVVAEVVGASAFLGGSWKFCPISAHALPHCSSQTRTYPPDCSDAEAMRKASTTEPSPVPWRLGPIGAQKLA